MANEHAHDHHHTHADGSDCHCEDASVDAATPAEAIDPVCGMTVVKANAQHTATLDGQTYYFCSESCRASFVRAPAKYLSHTSAHAH